MLNNPKNRRSTVGPALSKTTTPGNALNSAEQKRVDISERWLASYALPDGVPRERWWDTRLAGFGVIIGRRKRSFIAMRRVGSEIVFETLGHWGDAKARAADKSLVTMLQARDAAQLWLGQTKAGIDPTAERKVHRDGVTLREGLEAHLERMAKKRRSERSIGTMRAEVEKYLTGWLDRPIVEITGDVLIELHDSIKANAKARARSNPDNPKGAPLANRVISHVSAIWNTLNKRHHGKLGWNPAQAVDRDRLKPKRERIAGEDLPRYYADVQSLKHPIRRDGLVFALFTALRSEDVRWIRHEHADLKRRVLRLPDPKGGESAAFEIPLCATAVEILKRRAADNTDDLKAASDNGWAFPGHNNAGDVVAIGDLREQRPTGEIDPKTGRRKRDRFPVEDVHSLRRTYESISQEAGISELDQHVLTNHSFGGHNVNATYIAQSMEHLQECAATIERALWSRIKGAKKTRRSKKRVA